MRVSAYALNSSQAPFLSLCLDESAFQSRNMTPLVLPAQHGGQQAYVCLNIHK
jgi:hypothetical protein